MAKKLPRSLAVVEDELVEDGLAAHGDEGKDLLLFLARSLTERVEASEDLLEGLFAGVRQTEQDMDSALRPDDLAPEEYVPEPEPTLWAMPKREPADLTEFVDLPLVGSAAAPPSSGNDASPEPAPDEAEAVTSGRDGDGAEEATPADEEQLRLPDWVWGLFLALVALLLVGGYFLITGLGGGGNPCGGPLPSLPGNTNVTAEGFQEEDRKLGETIQYLSQGDIDNTFATFYGEVHAFTHNIDPDIRAVDEEMAKKLCELVIQVEEDYDPPPPDQRSIPKMSASTRELREHLRDVAEALGFPRPGG